MHPTHRVNLKPWVAGSSRRVRCGRIILRYRHLLQEKTVLHSNLKHAVAVSMVLFLFRIKWMTLIWTISFTILNDFIENQILLFLFQESVLPTLETAVTDRISVIAVTISGQTLFLHRKFIIDCKFTVKNVEWAEFICCTVLNSYLLNHWTINIIFDRQHPVWDTFGGLNIQQ